MVREFDQRELDKLYEPKEKSSNEDNGSVTIIGGSSLFHGAPILALKVASRIVDMVYFASPEPSVGRVAEKIKSRLMSFIWVPWDEVEAYIEKSDAVLIGPGLKRFASEPQNTNSKIQITNYDKEGMKTREITERLLKKFPEKKWVIDAGSLQVLDPELLPKGCIITPNTKEFEMLFSEKIYDLRFKTQELADLIKKKTREHDCVIVLKGPETIVCSPKTCVIVKGGNAGMTKGGTGDVLAGLTIALYAKNEPLLTATAASYIEKKAADKLYEKVGVNYNADDLADKIPETFFNLLSN